MRDETIRLRGQSSTLNPVLRTIRLTLYRALYREKREGQQNRQRVVMDSGTQQHLLGLKGELAYIDGPMSWIHTTLSFLSVLCSSHEVDQASSAHI